MLGQRASVVRKNMGVFASTGFRFISNKSGFFAWLKNICVSAEPKPLQVKPLEVKPLQVNPLEVKPIQVNPLEILPVQVLPVQIQVELSSPLTVKLDKLSKVEVLEKWSHGAARWAVIIGGGAAVIAYVASIYQGNKMHIPLESDQLSWIQDKCGVDPKSCLPERLRFKEITSFTVVLRNIDDKTLKTFRINLMPLLKQHAGVVNKLTPSNVVTFVESEVTRHSGESRYVVSTEMGLFLLPSNLPWPEDPEERTAKIQAAKRDAEDRLKNVDAVEAEEVGRYRACYRVKHKPSWDQKVCLQHYFPAKVL